MSGLRSTQAKFGTKTPHCFFSTCAFLYFLHYFISLNFFFTLFIMTVEYSRRSSGLSRIPTDTLSPSLCLVGTFRTVECKPQVNLDTSCTAVERERERKKGTFTFFCLSFFSLLSMLCPPVDSWASCPSAERWLWSLWPSKGSSRAPSCWRTAYTVGVSAGQQRGWSLMSSVAIPLGVLGQPQTSCCRFWSA